jgi:hypothetical protein
MGLYSDRLEECSKRLWVSSGRQPSCDLRFYDIAFVCGSRSGSNTTLAAPFYFMPPGLPGGMKGVKFSSVSQRTHRSIDCL